MWCEYGQRVTKQDTHRQRMYKTMEDRQTQDTRYDKLVIVLGVDDVGDVVLVFSAQGTEWVSLPTFEGVMVSVGQGRGGREVPSKEHDPGKEKVRGKTRVSLCIVQIVVRRSCEDERG